MYPLISLPAFLVTFSNPHPHLPFLYRISRHPAISSFRPRSEHWQDKRVRLYIFLKLLKFFDMLTLGLEGPLLAFIAPWELDVVVPAMTLRHVIVSSVKVKLKVEYNQGQICSMAGIGQGDGVKDTNCLGCNSIWKEGIWFLDTSTVYKDVLDICIYRCILIQIIIIHFMLFNDDN